MTSQAASPTMSGQPAWLTRAAVLAAAILFGGSLWQIGTGNAGTAWTPAFPTQASSAAASEAAAALRATIDEAEATKRQAELALQLLDDVCRTRGHDR